MNKRSQSTEYWDKKSLCPFCVLKFDENLGAHIREVHGDEIFAKAIIDEKLNGASDAQIGARFGISFNQLEKIITEYAGINIGKLNRPKKFRGYSPKDFHEQTTTVWSFKQRGNWATHSGIYRGNWSPYIPRNIILKYSNPGDCVLDYFVGGGTTAVEAKLLGRRCIAKDINPFAVKLTLENLSFPKRLYEEIDIFEPQVSVGDARNLKGLDDNSIDLICAHPPYAGIIGYSSAIEGDLSKFSVQEFLSEMGKVAKESLRVLKPGHKCVILIGDTRKSRHIVPIGFQTIRVFLNSGFNLKELIIKRQHNCKTTGFWYSRSIQYNFLLLAHEYLPVFEKPITKDFYKDDDGLNNSISIHREIAKISKENLETTTVWLFHKKNLDSEIRRNLQGRFLKSGDTLIEISFENNINHFKRILQQRASLIYVRFPQNASTKSILNRYLQAIKQIVVRVNSCLNKDGFLVLEARDFRLGQKFYPSGLFLYEDIANQKQLALKEIVIVVSEDNNFSDNLKIVHRYLFVYVKKGSD